MLSQELKLEQHWENVKPYDPADWIGIRDRDDDSSDEEPETEIDETVGNGNGNPTFNASSMHDDHYDEQDGDSGGSSEYKISASEQKAAEQVAAQWKAFLDGGKRAMKKNARENKLKSESSSSSSATAADDSSASSSSDKHGSVR
jgi:hypothetical protein